MTGKLLALGLAFFLTACAQPKYVSPAGGLDSASGAAKATSLAFPRSGLRAWISWELLPTENDFGSFLLKIGRANQADGSPLPLEQGAEPAVVLWMPSMGHGSSPVKVERVDVGTYRVSDVFFTMPGDWEIRVRRADEGSAPEETALAIRI